MGIDLNGELQKAKAVMEDAKVSLLASGFTEEQMDNLSKYVYAAIAHSQYAILEANREIRSESAESALVPGRFQTKILR